MGVKLIGAATWRRALAGAAFAMLACAVFAIFAAPSAARGAQAGGAQPHDAQPHDAQPDDAHGHDAQPRDAQPHDAHGHDAQEGGAQEGAASPSTPTTHAAHAEAPAPSELPPPTPEERAAAFPDLGDRDIHNIEHDDPFVTFVLLDQLEVGDRDQGSLLHWDLKAWAGRDLRKVWVRSSGARHGGSTEHAELEVLWGRALGPWWDWVAGVRHDFRPGPSRTWAAFGIQGLAPYWFELEGTLYLGEGGRAAATLEADYELLLTNRLIFQPVFKLEWHSRGDLERHIGSGVGSAEAGLRLRYEIRREVAPYLGVVRERRFGDSADLARAAGMPGRETWLVAGVRLWF